MSRSNLNVDFIKLLELELRKLSPSLRISSLTPDPLGQILEAIRLTIQTLLEERAALEQEHAKLNNETSPKSMNNSGEITYSKSKLAAAQKELSKIEALLQEKEKRVDLRENEIVILSNELAQQREELEREKLILDGKSKELEIRIRALQEKEGQFKIANDTLISERNIFELEKGKIMQMKKKLESNYKESELIREMNLVTQENLQRDIEKFSFEKGSFEQKSYEMEIKQAEIERMQEDLERKIKGYEEEKGKLQQDRDNLLKIKQQISDERLLLFEEKQETEKCIRSAEAPQARLSTSIDSIEGKDLFSLYEKLKSQIEVFNYEISLKESRLFERERKLMLEEKKVSDIYAKIIKAEDSLLITKGEIIQFNKECLPEIESLNKKAKSLLELINSKFEDLGSLYSRMEHNIYLFANFTGDEVVQKELLSAAKRAKTSLAVPERYSSEEIEELTKELESKLKEIKNKEKELDLEAIENFRASESLKEAKKRFAMAKSEVFDEKEKLRMQSYQLEMALKAITTREEEIVRYKQELDKRANLLNIRERQIQLRVLKASDLDKFVTSEDAS